MDSRPRFEIPAPLVIAAVVAMLLMATWGPATAIMFGSFKVAFENSSSVDSMTQHAAHVQANHQAR